MRRSVVVVATSDMPAPLRIRAAFVALAVAEYFRDAGKSVLLVMDSVTPSPWRQREIGTRRRRTSRQKGYPPASSICCLRFSSGQGNSRRLHHRVLTVLVEGDDFNEPVCDAVRAILDGHIILCEKLGARATIPLSTFCIRQPLTSSQVGRAALSPLRKLTARIGWRIQNVDSG